MNYSNRNNRQDQEEERAEPLEQINNLELTGLLDTIRFQLDEAADKLERKLCRELITDQLDVTFRNLTEAMTSSPFVAAFDDIIGGSLSQFMRLSGAVGDLVRTQSDLVSRAVQAQRQFLITAAQSVKPDDGTLQKLLKPTADLIQEIQDVRNQNRSSSFFNHLSAVSESIGALGWVCISPTPAPYVKEMVDASKFYTNKVLVAYKDKDKTHVDWANAWVSFLSELQAYIKQWHTTGLVWNPRGGQASVATSNGSSRNGFSATGPPPPPPPPPPMMDMSALNLNAGQGGHDDTRSALLRDLNKGTAITSSLKKVTSDMQTHKNPNLRSSSTVPAGNAHTGQSAACPRGGPASVPQRPPKFELEGKKWMIEYMNGRKDIVISDTEMNQSVNIYRCTDCLVQVKGKINSITVDECKKLSIVFDDLVSLIEFINSQRIQAQSMGKVPTVSVDKTDGVQVYLSAQSLDAEIVTSKSSEINISVPDRSGDFAEHPIPEQFKSVWNGKRFVTEAVEMA